MPSYGGMGNLGYLGLGIDNMESRLPAGMYDPNQFINPAMLPYMGMYLQPQMMRQMANFQQPQLMLPQNSGSFLAGAIGKLLGGGGSSQGQSQGAPQGQGLPNNALLQELYAIRNKALQGGMGIGQATAQGVQQLSSDPRFQDPTSQAVLDRFQEQAIKEGYKPELNQMPGNQIENFQDTNTGKIVGMTPAQWQAMGGSKSGYIRAENIPQIAQGRVQEYKKNGLYYAIQTGPDGKPKLIGTSTSPAQFVRGVQITANPDQIPDLPAGLMPDLSTASAGDRVRIELAQQETGVRNFDQQVNDIHTSLGNGAPGGLAGNIAEKADNIIGAVGQLANVLGDTKDFDSLVKNNYNGVNDIIDRFKVKGVQATRLNSELNAAAYLYWKANNPGEKISPKEITETKEELLGDSSDPNAIYQALDSARITTIRNFQNNAQEMDSNEKYYKPQWYGKNYHGPGSIYPAPAPQASAPTSPPTQAHPADIQHLIDKYSPNAASNQ